MGGDAEILKALAEPPRVVRPNRVDEVLGLLSPQVRQGFEAALANSKWSAGAIRGVFQKAGYSVAESTIRRWRKDHGV